MKTKLKKAVEILCEELSKDKSEGSYYYSWQANIAMAFQDEWNRSKVGKFMNDNEPEWLKDIVPDREEHRFVHKISNEAAKNFLNLLIQK
jgi:hypothetical protein